MWTYVCMEVRMKGAGGIWVSYGCLVIVGADVGGKGRRLDGEGRGMGGKG